MYNNINKLVARCKMEKLLTLSAGATNAIIIVVTCACVALLFFMLVYRKRKSIQQAHDGTSPAKKEKHRKHKKVEELDNPVESESHKDMLSDIIAVHEQKQAEAQEAKEASEEEPQEVDLKEVDNINADNTEE